MIYPSARAVLVAVAGAPVALLVGAALPGHWYLALAWPLTILLLSGADAWLGRGTASAQLLVPRNAYVGEQRDGSVEVTISSRPSRAEIALEAIPLVDIGDAHRLRLSLSDGRGAVHFAIVMVRRGVARFDRFWLRWTGPLGLVWHQRILDTASAFPILPDLRPVHRHGATLFRRYAAEGITIPVTRGEGSDFDALVEYWPGMDRRTIDWKRSAHTTKLLAKRYHSERNNQIVFVVDCGRQMCEPVDGIPRIDRLVAAMLLTGWLALKLGDRVALHAFDSRPRVTSGLVSGSGAFDALQRVAAQIDYSAEETNYTFALATLFAKLSRRSVVILFTEFTDAISANFLLAGLRRMTEKHVVLVVLLRDEELETLARRRPQDADDVTRAITASALLDERQVVITQLQHLGAHVIEADHDRVSEQLARAYTDLKRRNIV
ncbi:MAG: DUF58 domain-containing protein [Pseudomonadota bacterium]